MSTLTRTHLSMLPLLAAGLTNRQIGRHLGRTAPQVGHDIERMLLATGTRSRGELIAYGYTHGHLDPAAWPPRAA